MGGLEEESSGDWMAGRFFFSAATSCVFSCVFSSSSPSLPWSDDLLWSSRRVVWKGFLKRRRGEVASSTRWKTHVVAQYHQAEREGPMELKMEQKKPPSQFMDRFYLIDGCKQKGAKRSSIQLSTKAVGRNGEKNRYAEGRKAGVTRGDLLR